MELTHVQIERIGTSLCRLKAEQSVHRNGPLPTTVQEPLTAVRVGESLELVDGFKRLALLKAQGATQAPVCIIAADLKQAKALMLSLNTRRRTITLWEEARLVEELSRNDGLSTCAVARLLSRTENWVLRRLGFIRRLNEDLHPFVQAGHIGPQAAFHLTRLPSSLQMPLFLSFCREKLTTRELDCAVSLILAAEGDQTLRIAQSPRSFLAQAQVHADTQEAEERNRLSRRLETTCEEIRTWRREQGAGPHTVCAVPTDRQELDDRVLLTACKRLEHELSLLRDCLQERSNANERTTQPRDAQTHHPGHEGEEPLGTPDRKDPGTAQDHSPAVTEPVLNAPGETPEVAGTIETRSVLQTDRGTESEGGPNHPRDLPDSSPGGLCRWQNDPLRQDTGTARLTQDAAGVRPVRTSAGTRSADGLVPVHSEDRFDEHKDTPLLDDSFLQSLPVHGNLR